LTKRVEQIFDNKYENISFKSLEEDKSCNIDLILLKRKVLFVLLCNHSRDHS